MEVRSLNSFNIAMADGAGGRRQEQAFNIDNG